MIKRSVGHLTFLLSILCGSDAHAQGRASAGEVRQIVTFLFQPGRSADAHAIYEKQLKPIYEGVGPLRRFRAYREMESSEPLDLIVVSSYDGMDGMDAANEALRRAPAGGSSAFALYGTLSAMTQHHHDQFVELLPALSDTAQADGLLTVFQYVRVAPGAQKEFESQIRYRVRKRDKKDRLYEWSETGRMLVSDGWDYLLVFGVRTLGDWQRLQHALLSSESLNATIAGRKTIIVRGDSRLSVR